MWGYSAMIDLHAHIIHGVDDGPKQIEGSLALIQQAIDQGVLEIIATPHYHLPAYDNYLTQVKYQELVQAVKAKNMPITLHLGNEVHADELILTHFKKGCINTLAGSRYILLELPFYKLYPVHHDLIFQLQKENYKVILAHVDRYHYFHESPQLLKGLVEKGCYGQLSQDYVINKPKEAKRLIQSGQIHVIASDMHHTDKRPNQLKLAKALLERLVGKETAHTLLVTNPKAVIEDEPITRFNLQAPKISWLRQFIG